MGWFLRKSFRVGPLRLNLSKRGIGASVGVKGARLGVDATGKPYAAGGRYGLYFRESLGASHPQEPAGEMGPTGEREASNPRGPRWWVLVLLALVIGIIVGVVLARAGEQTRVDLFDAQGRRTGYSVVDQGTGRVDFYDTMSRRTGYGRVDGVGKVERFGLDGKRQADTAVPVSPKADRPDEGGYNRPGRKISGGASRARREHIAQGRPDMITDIASYLRFFDGVRRRTERDIAALPPMAAAWRSPVVGGEAGWNIGEIVAHIGGTRLYFASAYRGEGWIWVKADEDMADQRNWLPWLETSAERYAALLRDTPEAWLKRRVEMIDTPGATLSGWRLLMMMLEHEVHHRSQIDTYAGLEGWPVPDIFGRSAESIDALQESERTRHGR